ncbi:MAG: polymer-forming cytoskeletal protein [Myxococcales bacterium FL481]|nr:MAG: polymer-forming cytoskeletal protein [Myxococcales bacterium FL481]
MEQEITTVLGKGSAFEGKLSFEGAVRIDGDFSGEIQTEGTLIVGETANVAAEIRAANVVVQGTARGDIAATSSLEIHQPARVHGNLSTPSLVIQKGARFEGNCTMTVGDAPTVADADS